MVRIVKAASPRDIASVRTLFEEYARAVDAPACFDGFGRELDALPGEYAPPGTIEAQALYRSLGLRPTGPYLACPTPGASCFELML